MMKQGKVRASRSMTKEELAGEIYDINKKNGYKNPYSRKKAINIMVNGLDTVKGFTKAELAETRDSLLGIKPQKQNKAAEVKSASSLSPKIAKAEELRRLSVKASDKATKINKTSLEEFKQATTSEEKDKVRKKWKDKRTQSKLESDKAWREYKDYLRKTFGIDNVYSETNEAYGGTEKGFIDWLRAKFSPKKRGKK